MTLVDNDLRFPFLDSPPGPSGLRIQHPLEALSAASRDALLEQVTYLTNAIAQGATHAELAPHLAGVGLMVLSTPKGGVCPMAVGGIWRHITWKCLCAKIKEQALSFFPPPPSRSSQVGVVCPLGIDAAVHIGRA